VITTIVVLQGKTTGVVIEMFGVILKTIPTDSYDMNWTEKRILLEQNKYTPCQEIFQAVCDEIGKVYEQKGFKYSRSKPRITIEKNNIKLIISFSSSRSNTPGDWVALEILPAFYAKQLSKSSNTKGFLFGHTGLFYHKYTDNPNQIRVQKIFGEIIERIDEHSNESKLIESHSCNVYGLDSIKFNKIIDFIDNRIIVWLDKLQTGQGILELTENASGTRVWSLNGKGGNSDFIEYVTLNFPNIDIVERLEK
jgi:hypothetical protein